MTPEENREKKKFRRKNELGNNRFFNLNIGIGGAVFMSVLVYFTNSDYGFLPASIAAAKQAVYTFLMAGTNLKIAENLVIKIKKPGWGIFIGTLVPSVLTIGATYLVHSLKGTPEPFASTVPTILLGPPSIALFVYHKRKQLKKIRKKNGV